MSKMGIETEPRLLIAVDQGQLQEIMRELSALRKEIAGVRMAPKSEWVPVGEYAASINRSEKTVRNWVRDGKIRSRREGNVLMICGA